MDLLGLLRELSSAGISDVVLLVVIPLLTRYWIIEAKQEMRQEMRGALDDKSKEIYRYIDTKFEAQDTKFEAQDARFDAQDIKLKELDARFDAQDAHIDQLDRKNDVRAYDITSHLIDVRERLANIEGRMGIYPPRRGVEPPMPEPAPEQERSELSRS